MELALIRYLPAHVKYFSYFTNFVLLAAFLGSGVGLLVSTGRHKGGPGIDPGRHKGGPYIAWLWPVGLVVLTAVTLALSNVAIDKPDGEHFWGLYGAPSPRAVTMGLVPTVLLLFALLAVVFVPLGARLGELFGKFPPLQAYALDIGGALAGIAAFTILSRAGTPPLVWFAIGTLVALLVLPGRVLRIGSAVAGVISLALVAREREPGERWSPYYRITLHEGVPGTTQIVSVNGSVHQLIVNFASTHNLSRQIHRDFNLPYQFAENLDTVLVVGAGTGNDINILLARGAKYIDAVEIDPEIARLGRTRNPANPYADPRVHLHVDDARAFLRKTTRRYNVIVFGTLDSQALLSGMTSLRLDNYVYTVESMRDARARLAPEGKVITYHMSGLPFIAARIHQAMWLAFGAMPVAMYINPHVLFNYVFIAGVPGTSAEGLRSIPWLATETALPTDDWPYLYLDEPGIPRFYALALGGVLLIAIIGVSLALRLRPRGPGPGLGRGQGLDFDAPMFFLGTGFLLVETKSVTEMALLFGSTWIVNVAVFAAILSVVLLGTWRVAKGGARDLTRIFVGLFLALALGAAIPVRAFSGAIPGGSILAAAVAALPVLLSALIFPRLLAIRADPARALGWNVLGAIVGGVLEYASMVAGIKLLYGLAALAYGAAWFASRREA